MSFGGNNQPFDGYFDNTFNFTEDLLQEEHILHRYDAENVGILLPGDISASEARYLIDKYKVFLNLLKY